VSTDPEGNYRITFLPLGTYRVEAKTAGFELSGMRAFDAAVTPERILEIKAAAEQRRKTAVA